MTYDHELILIKQDYIQDDIGNQIPIEHETVVLCGLKSVARNEFYNAALASMKPEIVFVIHGFEYNGETKVKFESVTYKVLRTYSVDFEEIELTCEKVVGDG